MLEGRFFRGRISLEQQAAARSDVLRLEVALLVYRGRGCGHFNRLLLLGRPRYRLVSGKLVIGSQFEIESGDVLAVGYGQHGRCAHIGLLHLYLVAIRRDEQAVGIGTGEGEVPVGAIILHQRGVPVERGVHFHAAILFQHLFYNVAVFLFLEDAVLASLRGRIGVVATLHHHVGTPALNFSVALPMRFSARRTEADTNEKVSFSLLPPT